MNLLKEAQKISEELDDVVFIGAIAVQAHTGRVRQTHDIDLALTSPMADEELENVGILRELKMERKYGVHLGAFELTFTPKTLVA